MTGKPALILGSLGVATAIGTEILRYIVHRHRQKTQDIVSTQDIAMWGTFLGWAFFIGAGICFLLWKLKH
jgi:hypothetical protein